MVNKIDMEVPNKKEKLAKLSRIAEQYNLLYFEVSALTRQGISEMFQSLIDSLSQLF